MNKQFYNFIINKEHHKYRHNIDWDIAGKCSKKNLHPVERMADRFERLCYEENR